MSDTRPDTSSIDDLFETFGTSESMRRKEASTFSVLFGDARRAVIVGCGALGQIVQGIARKSGIELACFADNDLARQVLQIGGLPVLSPAEAVSRFGADAYFIVAIFNSAAPQRQLRQLKCPRIVPFPVFAWRYADAFPAMRPIDPPHRILARAESIEHGFLQLSDEKSRTEFLAQLAWRCTLDYERLPPSDAAASIYFPSELVRLGADEVFVDCGAFDGDSLRLFLERSGGRCERIVACEPDPANREALRGNIARLPAGLPERIAVFPYAIGDHDGVVSFEASSDAGAHISTAATQVRVECRRLDSVLQDVRPTFIKMDIEGAEPEALRGAFQTIRRARPILAVCAYHKCDHLWTLPALMKEALPDYQISLRRYAEECWELVYYAVPPERAIAY